MPGKYRFYCPVNGMEGTMVVKELATSLDDSDKRGPVRPERRASSAVSGSKPRPSKRQLLETYRGAEAK